MKELLQAALEGKVAAIARLITLTGSAGVTALEVQEGIFPHTGNAHLVGITGPAGAGKSTLIGKLAATLATHGQKVAIVACDPSSPKTGGALLGDRIRMHSLIHDENVFIRSIATGGSAGGLPLAAFRAADILDACGFNTVIIETVGTGQNQVDIMQARCRNMYQQRIYREAIDILSQSFKGNPDEYVSTSLERLIKRELTPTQAALEAIGRLK